MYFKQITVDGLGCNSYVIGCPGARQTVVVDPKRDVQDYMDISRDEGMRISHIIETHVHALPCQREPGIKIPHRSGNLFQ